MSSKNKVQRIEDVANYLDPRNIFFENIINGCIAIEKLVLLTASTPDVNLAEGRSLRVSIFDAIEILEKSYSEAGNVINKAKLYFDGIPSKIHQWLETYRENPNQSFQNLQTLINAGVKAVEENVNIFADPRRAFIELNQSFMRAKEEQESKKIYEQMKAQWEAEMKDINGILQKKQGEFESMKMIISKIYADIEELRKKDKTCLNCIYSKNTEDELHLSQLKNAKTKKTEIQREIGTLEEKLREIKYNIINAETEPLTDWQDIIKSLNKIISHVVKIEQTWKSLVDPFKYIKREVETLHSACRNTITRYIEVSLNSWVISQCCGIYDDIVTSHIIPLLSGVSSNFGLRADEAKSKLSNKKTKAKNVREEVTKVVNKQLTEAVNNFATVKKETEHNFNNIFSTPI